MTKHLISRGFGKGGAPLNAPQSGEKVTDPKRGVAHAGIMKWTDNEPLHYCKTENGYTS